VPELYVNSTSPSHGVTNASHVLDQNITPGVMGKFLHIQTLNLNRGID
jgi:hypothetical protein